MPNPSASSSSTSNQSSVRSQINSKLLESGEYARLAKSAKRKFDETGWTDEIRAIANRHIRTMKPLKFSSLSEAVRPQAEDALDPETRREILIMVAGVVRQMIQEAEQGK